MRLDEKQSAISLHQVGTLSNHHYEIARVDFSPDGSLLASIEDGAKELQIWNAFTRKQVNALLFDHWPIDFSFSPNGTQIAIMEANDAVSLWESTGERCLDRVSVHGCEIAFLLDENTLIVVEKTGKISFWDISLKPVIFSFLAILDNSDAVYLAISPATSCLALTSTSHKIFLWLFDSLHHEAVHLTTLDANVDEGLAFSPKGEFLAFFAYTPSEQSKKYIQVYNVQQLRVAYNLISPTPFIGTERAQSIAFSPESTYLVAPDIYGMLYFWKLNEERLSYSFLVHRNPENLPYYGIRALAWSETNKYLATGGWDLPDASLEKGKFVVKLWKVDHT